MNDFQQVFLRWMDMVRNDLVIQPYFDEFDGRNLLYRLDGCKRCIALVVSPTCVSIEAFKGEVSAYQSWDSLFRRNACEFVSCRVEGYSLDGLSCRTEDHDHRCHTPDCKREDILAEHCFEPLKQWIIDELQPAYWLLFEERSYGEVARLQKQEEPEPDYGDEDDMCERIGIKTRRRFRPTLRATLRQKHP